MPKYSSYTKAYSLGKVSSQGKIHLVTLQKVYFPVLPFIFPYMDQRK